MDIEILTLTKKFKKAAKETLEDKTRTLMDVNGGP